MSSPKLWSPVIPFFLEDLIPPLFSTLLLNLIISIYLSPLQSYFLLSNIDNNDDNNIKNNNAVEEEAVKEATNIFLVFIRGQTMYLELYMCYFI